ARKAREIRNKHIKALLVRVTESGLQGDIRATAEELAAIGDFEWLGDVTDKRISLTMHSPERVSERTLEPLAGFVQCLHTSLWQR
ncbi:hypothetical protein NL529_31530, partial [Klebsiella pneumoniae]|nr:hypothetical protein [Klebsiella pneumoniae]